MKFIRQIDRILRKVESDIRCRLKCSGNMFCATTATAAYFRFFDEDLLRRQPGAPGGLVAYDPGMAASPRLAVHFHGASMAIWSSLLSVKLLRTGRRRALRCPARPTRFEQVSGGSRSGCRPSRLRRSNLRCRAAAPHR